MIRILNGADAQALRDIRLLSLTTDPLSFNSQIELESRYSLNFFASKIYNNTNSPRFGIYGVFENDKLIAYTQLTQEYLPKQLHLANIFEVYVNPDHRRKGIARKLLEHVIKQAKQVDDLEQLHLRVNSSNQNAKALYESLGFKHIATREKVIKEKDHYQDEHQYVLHIKH